MNIGQRVVCINDKIDPDKMEEIKKDVPNWIKENEIYTIRDILTNDDIVTGLLLEEVHNRKIFFRIINRSQEPAFGLFRFREIATITETAKAESKKKLAMS